ncbi:MAG: chromate transporter [Clostridia bacterium]|nr:chromate transporter [Clostridia bacterium]
MSALLQLFISFFKIGAFSFGGGYAMLPLIEEEVIHTHNWITSAEYIDILAIAEMTPGPIAINSATFLGYRVYGVLGSIVATLGVVLPSFIVMTLIFMFIVRFKNSPYVNWVFKGIRPVVIGLIAAAAVSVGRTSLVDYKAFIMAVGIFYFVTFRKLNPILAIVLSGVLGIILY